METKWSRTYFYDLGERVASTVVYGLITLFAANNIADIDAELGWAIVGLPALLSLLKGLGANLAGPASGPSLLPSPPAPEVNEDGVSDMGLLVVAMVVILVVLLVFGR